MPHGQLSLLGCEIDYHFDDQITHVGMYRVLRPLPPRDSPRPSEIYNQTHPSSQQCASPIATSLPTWLRKNGSKWWWWCWWRQCEVNVGAVVGVWRCWQAAVVHYIQSQLQLPLLETLTHFFFISVFIPVVVNLHSCKLWGGQCTIHTYSMR